MQVYFADGITNISLSGSGLVRLEFGSVEQVPQGESNQPATMKPTQQVVMPLDGFLRAFGAQEQIMKKLIEDGLVKRRDEESVIQ